MDAHLHSARAHTHRLVIVATLDDPRQLLLTSSGEHGSSNPISSFVLFPQIAELNRRGDLLVTYGHTWEQGQREVVCVDFDTGETILLPLSPGEHYSQYVWEACDGKRSLSSIVQLSVIRSILQGLSCALQDTLGNASHLLPTRFSLKTLPTTICCTGIRKGACLILQVQLVIDALYRQPWQRTG